jgi:hypothetical protein
MYYEWAADHAVHDYHGDPDGGEIFAQFLELFRREATDLTPASIVAACQNSEKINFSIPG